MVEVSKETKPLIEQNVAVLEKLLGVKATLTSAGCGEEEALSLHLHSTTGQEALQSAQVSELCSQDLTENKKRRQCVVLTNVGKRVLILSGSRSASRKRHPSVAHPSKEKSVMSAGDTSLFLHVKKNTSANVMDLSE